MTYINNLWIETITDKRTGKARKRYRVRKVVHGRQRYGTFSNRVTADLFLAQLEGEAAGVTSRYKDDSIGHVMKEFVKIKKRPTLNRSRHTIDDYARSAKTLERVIGATAPCQLKERQVDHFVMKRQRDGAGNRRILKELKHLRSAMRRVLEVEPVWRLPEIRAEEIDKRIPSDAEIAAVYSTLDRSALQRAFLLGLLTGMRPQDVIMASREWLTFDPVTWAAIKPKARVINIKMSKRRGRSNPTYVTETLAKALESVGDADTLTGLTQNALKMSLWRRTGHDRTRISKSTGKTVVDKAATNSLKLDHPWYGVHALRHVVATWLGDAEFTEAEIGIVLGHGAEKVAGKHYIHSVHFPIKQRALETIETRFLEALAVHAGHKEGKVVSMKAANE